MRDPEMGLLQQHRDRGWPEERRICLGRSQVPAHVLSDRALASSQFGYSADVVRRAARARRLQPALRSRRIETPRRRANVLVRDSSYLDSGALVENAEIDPFELRVDPKLKC